MLEIFPVHCREVGRVVKCVGYFVSRHEATIITSHLHDGSDRCEAVKFRATDALKGPEADFRVNILEVDTLKLGACGLDGENAGTRAFPGASIDGGHDSVHYYHR